MKSPQLLTSVLIASAAALIGFFAGDAIGLHGSSLAIGLFIGCIVSPIGLGALKNEDASVEIKTLYVGNLPYRANEAAVRDLFQEHGVVHSVRLMKDKQTGKRRGFGFVEMAASDANTAVDALNDTEFQQRTLKVREAKERPEPNANHD